MNIKKHIPNAITCCNLLCGCLAIVQIFEGNLIYAAYLVGLAAIFDFFDGFAARMLKVSSAIGKDLDSLADMITFGVVPGLVMFKLIQLPMANYQGYSHGDELPLFYPYLKYVAFIIPIFSALRLAKFNNDTRQTESFIGLNTPANSMFICSIAIIFINDYHNIFDFDSCLVSGFYPKFLSILFDPHLLCLMSIFLSLLLVSEIPMFSLKFKHFKWKGNEIRFIFLALSLLMLITLQFLGIPLIIILYVLLSLLTNYLAKRKVTTQ
jgi:CDP-diacylglycerol--serine O-phosphatidyltransferase